MLEEPTKKLTPIRAIRAHCLDCMGGSSHEVELCQSANCNLFPYRFGKNPALANREGPSPEVRAKGLAKIRAGRVMGHVKNSTQRDEAISGARVPEDEK